MMPDDWKSQLAGCDAILFAAAGGWGKVTDHISLWGSRLDPHAQWNTQQIGILRDRFVLQPGRFDIVAASNLFGDILSELGPACTGATGISSSANLNPDRLFPSLFESVHGSTPDILGKNMANPVGMIRLAALMRNFPGELNIHDDDRRSHSIRRRRRSANSGPGQRCNDAGSRKIRRIAHR